jgi:hypothetical protein
MDTVLHLFRLLGPFECAHRFYATDGFRPVSSVFAGSSPCAVARETAVKRARGTFI